VHFAQAIKLISHGWSNILATQSIIALNFPPQRSYASGNAFTY